MRRGHGPAVRTGQRRRTCSDVEPELLDRATDVVIVTVEADVGDAAVPQQGHRSVDLAEQLVRVTIAREPTTVAGDRSRAQDHVAEEAERPVRPDEQTTQVEAADVLHRGTARFGQLSGGRHVTRLEQDVAHRTMPEACDGASPERERSPDGPSRWQRNGLAVLGERRQQLVDRRPGTAFHDHLRRVDPLDTCGCRHGTYLRHGAAPAARSGDRHRLGRADVRGEFVEGQIHATVISRLHQGRRECLHTWPDWAAPCRGLR